MTTFRVVHVTEYKYDGSVSASFGELHLVPRDTPDQRCVRQEIHIDPGTLDLRTRTDFFGNRTEFFALTEPHDTLRVEADSEVVVERVVPDGSSPVWEDARAALASSTDDEALEAAPFALATPGADGLAEATRYAAPSFAPGRPALEVLTDLCHRIRTDFAYKPGATTVGSTIGDLLTRRAGVCQDFAHLLVAGLRGHGLAARYVSGYLETYAPPGQKKLTGVDASHAWVSLWIPGLGWVDGDPTNDKLADDRYITTAWGRDYRDVTPLKGVIFTSSTRQTMKVAVDVLRLE